MSDLLQQLLVTGLGAFAGAWAAFRYEARTDQRRSDAANLAAGQHALFSLCAQLSWLANNRTSLELADWEGHVAAWCRVPAVDGRAQFWFPQPATEPPEC